MCRVCETKSGVRRFARYVRFVVVTLKFETFKGWLTAGEPEPFPKLHLKNRFTSQPELQDLFRDIFATMARPDLGR